MNQNILDAVADGQSIENDEQASTSPNAEGERSQSQNERLGSGPSGPIADGGGGAEKQRKEQTGKDSNMGGAGGGTAGMGKSKEKSPLDTEDDD